MDRIWIFLGALSGLLAVAAGAFGAHGLKDRIEPRLLDVFETGARYQMFHALALLAVGILSARAPSWRLALSGWCFAAGTLVFSGSLYVLALTGAKWLGAVTPLGGVALLGGWALLAAAALRRAPHAPGSP